MATHDPKAASTVINADGVTVTMSVGLAEYLKPAGYGNGFFPSVKVTKTGRHVLVGCLKAKPGAGGRVAILTLGDGTKHTIRYSGTTWKLVENFIKLLPSGAVRKWRTQRGGKKAQGVL
jgi:hypothetical protein